MKTPERPRNGAAIREDALGNNLFSIGALEIERPAQILMKDKLMIVHPFEVRLTVEFAQRRLGIMIGGTAAQEPNRQKRGKRKRLHTIRVRMLDDVLKQNVVLQL